MQLKDPVYKKLYKFISPTTVAVLVVSLFHSEVIKAEHSQHMDSIEMKQAWESRIQGQLTAVITSQH